MQEKSGLIYRVALLIGVGIIGFVSGLALGIVLFFFTQGAVVSIFGFAVGKFCFVYLPLTMSAVLASFGTLWPDPTGDFVTRVWRAIARIFEAT